MKRSEKFRQANKEAKATCVAAAAVIIFWCLAGFGLADSDITLLHMDFCCSCNPFPQRKGF